MLAGSATAAATSPPADASANYAFATLNNPADTTFNQLLGINASGLIAGYFGSGMAGHPNKGYLLLQRRPRGLPERELPRLAQTQVTGLNNVGVTVGFWADQKGDNFGFYATGGHRFHVADYPAGNAASPAVDQLLGVDDQGVAVGFYNDAKGNAHGYTYNIATAATAASTRPRRHERDRHRHQRREGHRRLRDQRRGHVEGFLLLNNGRRLHPQRARRDHDAGLRGQRRRRGRRRLPARQRQERHDARVRLGTGARLPERRRSAGIGATTVNGINDHGRLVGFYTDASGNTDGFLATPQG